MAGEWNILPFKLLQSAELGALCQLVNTSLEKGKFCLCVCVHMRVLFASLALI